MTKRRRTRYDPYAPPDTRRAGRRRSALLWLGAGGAAVVSAGTVALTRPAGESTAAPVDLDLDTVTVDRPAIDLGRVRLDVKVPVSVRLTNQSRRTVILRQATVEALEGC